MKSKHTPGPWIAPNEHVNLVLAKRNWDDGYLIGEFQCEISLNQGEDIARANANLIAAAPTMFDAIDLAIRHLETLRGRINDGESPNMDIVLSDIEFDLEQALKKARGE
jgi:hypothetical protein